MAWGEVEPWESFQASIHPVCTGIKMGGAAVYF